MGAKRLTDEQLSYIAKFYEVNGPVHCADALDITINTVFKRYIRMQATRTLEHYRWLWDKDDINRLERR